MSDTRPQVVMTGPEYAARQLAEEMAKQRENPLDVAKVPGGIFQRADGTLQNANGEPVNEQGKVVQASAPSAPDEEDEAPAAPARSAGGRRR